MEILNFTALQLADAIKNKKISVIEATSAYINNIEKTNPTLNSFIYIAKEQALSCAEKVQNQICDGEVLSPLAGVPIAIKDNISTKNLPTTCASKTLENYTPIFNATVVDKLEQAGMIIIGKLNMDEFAMGSTTETGIFGSVKNPWDTTRSAGGSSGGSSAAVAGKQVPLTLGTDTGGSIRQPCSFCGVTGIKPTYGTVSRHGLIAYASSLDQIGPIGHTIEDCAALLSIISGHDEKDSTSALKKSFNFDEKSSLNGMKIGFCSNYFEYNIDDDVKTSLLNTAKQFKELGADVEEFDMPYIDCVIPTYCILANAEASTNFAKYDGITLGHRSDKAENLTDVYRLSRGEGFGLEVKRRVMLGSFLLSSGQYETYYKKAMKVRTLIKDAYRQLFEKYDMILAPVTSSAAYKLGKSKTDPVKLYLSDMCTASVNLAGLPAAALPCGFNSEGLPLGFQLIGNAFSEQKLINAGRIYQENF